VNRLHVAMVSEHASPLAALGGADAGGQNVHVRALAEHLAALGHRVTVHTRRDDPARPERVAMAPGVTVHHVEAGPATALPKDELFELMPELATGLRAAWAADPPDIVHAHFWMSGFAAVVAARTVGVPVVQTFHALGTVKRRHQGDADTSPPQRLDVERWLLRRVAAVVATCRDEVEELLALDADAERLHVVPCGVDADHFTPDGPATPRAPGLRRIVSVGRLVPRKGVDDVVRALVAVPATELLVVGGPPAAQLDADPEVRRLRAIAARAGVGDRVRFLGALGRDEVPALLRSADLAVCVPWYEPFGIVPLEAQACGTPVVGSRVGGLLDSVDDGRTGVLVPPRDPRLLGAAVVGLLDRPGRRAAMGRHGVEHVRRRFTWPKVAADTLGAYAHVLTRHNAAVPA
jgi:glycosyltransferase involved in cell wall biosynthesis